MKRHNKSGWGNEERELLLQNLKAAAGAGVPLRDVFEKVGRASGRKPNSVRNYYYTKVRSGLCQERACQGLIRRDRVMFSTFSPGEISTLLKVVLAAQAQRQSVRACTLELGQGDRSRMLRYQNKYRSLLKTHRGLVEEAMAELRAGGVPFMNPFTREIYPAPAKEIPRPRGRRKAKTDVHLALEELKYLQGGSLAALVEGLKSLASLAAAGEAALKENRRLKELLTHTPVSLSAKAPKKAREQ